MVKLKKLYIENFQSLKDVTIHFDENGAYHIKGKHNIGKSAIVKAINTLFNNASRFKYSSFLRDNCDTFTIEGVFYDGGVVKLSRGANDFYEWHLPNNKSGVLEKTDGKVPVELVEYFNLYNIYEKNTTTLKVSLNVRKPRNKLIFVDTTAGENYAYFQKAMRTEHFLSASKLAKSEKREITNRKKVEQDKLIEYTDVLDTVEKYYLTEKNLFDKVEKQHEIIEQEYVQVTQAKEMLAITDDLLVIKREMNETANIKKNDVVTKIEDIDTVLIEIQNLMQEQEKMASIISLANEVDEIETERTAIQKTLTMLEQANLSQEIKQYNFASDFISLSEYVSHLNQEIIDLESFLTKFTETEKTHSEYQNVSTLYTLVVEHNVMQKEITQLETFVQEYNETSELIQLTGKVNDYFTSIKETQEMRSDIKQNKEILAQYQQLQDEMANYQQAMSLVPMFEQVINLEENITQAKEEYVQADNELTEFMREHNYCPIVEMTLTKQCPFTNEKING